MVFSENVRQIEGSSTLAIAALCRELRLQGRDILDLSIGEPDFRTPDFISEAGIASVRQGKTHYPPVPGIPELRKAIAQTIERDTGRKADPLDVLVTSGAKQAVFNACFTLFGPGDEVLIPAPYWLSYPTLVKLARAEPRIVASLPERGFKVDVNELEAAYTPRVRGLILNSPSNPTGVLYTRDELAAIVEWARKRNIWLISDEIYGRICYSAPRAASVLDVAESLDNILIIDGASKAFAMTGWRLGYSFAPRQVTQKMSDVQSQITSGASSPAQYAAAAAYADVEQSNSAVKAMVEVFRSRRDNLIRQFRELLPDAQFVEPDGAFYLFARFDRYYNAERPNSAAFCKWLLGETDVALIPGDAFGDDRFLRLSYAAPSETIEEAVRRIARAVAATPAHA